MAGQIVKAAGTEPEMLKQLLSFLLRYGFGGPRVGHHGVLVLPGAGGADDQRVGKQFQSGMRDAQLTAFSTSSSNAPSYHAMRSRPIGREHAPRVCPAIGATVNMDGTSCTGHCGRGLGPFHMVVAFSQQAVIVLTATLASIGRQPCPAGLV